MRKKIYVLAALVLPIFLLSLSNSDDGDGSCSLNGKRKSSGPPACFAGEPPNRTTCKNSDCHNSYALNSGSALLLLDLGGADTGYIPGQNYTITVALTKAGLTRGGFQLIALQDNNDTISPGIFTLTNTARTQRIDKQNPHAHADCNISSKVWIEHTDGGIDDVSNDSLTWQFDWQAPVNDVGSVTFYVAANEADADLDNTGDYIYSTFKTSVSPTTGIGINKPLRTIRAYPNPASNLIYLEMEGTIFTPEKNTIIITDATGRTVFKQPYVNPVFVKNLPTGRYCLRIEGKNQTHYCQFVKIE